MIITKAKLLNRIARRTKFDLKDVKEQHRLLEEIIFEILSSTTPENNADNPIVIKLFDGIVIEGVYKPEKQKTLSYVKDEDGNPLTVTVRNSVGLKARITESYKKKVSKALD